MNRVLHILNVVGARPNFMKVAPLMLEYAKYSGKIRATLVHTGQHYDEPMSAIFFSQLRLPEPDIYLGVGPGSHAVQTAKIMIGFERVLEELHPDLIVVVGDVNSTLACSLVASKLQVPVAHVEAGLRSFDRTMPEEINRVLVDSLSDYLFTTSEDANENLRREGISASKVFFVGNTMIDTLLRLKPLFNTDSIRQKLSLDGKPYVFITLHRPSNVDNKETLLGICDIFCELQEKISLVWPVHPRTRNMLQEYGLLGRLEMMRNLRIIEPMSYLDATSLIAAAEFVLTDSGGIQEETTVLGVPCLTLRENTERPVTVTEGTNELVGNNPDVIRRRTLDLLRGNRKVGRVPKYWDGMAGSRIVQILAKKAEIVKNQSKRGY